MSAIVGSIGPSKSRLDQNGLNFQGGASGGAWGRDYFYLTVSSFISKILLTFMENSISEQ